MPKNPYRNTPIVFNGNLTDYGSHQEGSEAHSVPFDSAEWFDWLQTASRFAYRVRIDTPVEAIITLTFRHETKQRGGRYWVAYTKDRAGKLHKLYAGRSETLHLERLEQVGQLMIKKLSISYPTIEAEPSEEISVVKEKPRKPQPQQTRQSKFPPLTLADLKPFRVFTKMLDFCSEEFEKRWGRPWRWVGGRIVRSSFDKNYYVWSEDDSEHEFLADQRYFIMRRLLHWVNHGYDKGYDHKLPNI
jgi:hypothetical protein